MMSAPDWPAALAARPVCPKRQLPIPFINEIAPDGTGVFAILDDTQARRCLNGRLCAMCGDPMGWWVVLIGDPVSLDPVDPGGGFFIEAPVHERCAEIATLGGLCPYLSRQRVPRRPLPDDVAVVGSGADLPEVARTIRKRPLIMAVTHGYTTTYKPSNAGGRVLVYRAGAVKRVRTFDYDDATGRLAETTAPAPAPARSAVRVQRRKGARRG